MKKILSLLLSFALVLLLIVPAAAEPVCPTVYLEGQGVGIYRPDGTRIYPYDVEWLPLIKEHLESLLKKAAVGVIDDYASYNEELEEMILPVFEDCKLGKDGLPVDGSSNYDNWEKIRNSAAYIQNFEGSAGTLGRCYRWHYDWRLSPVLLAGQLDELIDDVLAKTGASKVNIVARCLGTNIAYAYLCKYGTDKVNSCVFYTASAEGIETLDAFFTGTVTLDPGAVDRFLEYVQEEKNIVIRDGDTTELILSLVALFEKVRVLGLGLDQVEHIYNDIKDTSVVEIIRGSYGTYPSYWSFVKPEHYEKAKKYVFGGVEDEWAGLIAQTDEYNAMKQDFNAKIQQFASETRIAVIAKYGTPNIPLDADSKYEGDMFETAKIASFGCTAAVADTTLSAKHIAAAKANGTDKYISADKKIDASTCALPDQTWFIKGLEHRVFPYCVNDLIWAFISGEIDDVNSDPRYTQYLQYSYDKDGEAPNSDCNVGAITPIVTMADTTDTTQNYSHSPLQALFDFLAKFFRFIVGLFKKQ